jgi:hypothetical protein
VATAPDPLPDDADALKAALIEAHARLSGAEALIEHLQLVIAKMKREKFGPRSERSQRLLDQMELQFEELRQRRARIRPGRRPPPSRCGASRGARRHAVTFLPICRAGASFMRRQ